MQSILVLPQLPDRAASIRSLRHLGNHPSVLGRTYNVGLGFRGSSTTPRSPRITNETGSVPTSLRTRLCGTYSELRIKFKAMKSRGVMWSGSSQLIF
jgi:hypothetical protein